MPQFGGGLSKHFAVTLPPTSTLSKLLNVLTSLHYHKGDTVTVKNSSAFGD